MVLQMPWNQRYQITFSPEFQALASQITNELTKAFKTLEGFISVQVLRLWKSSVGVDFVVLVRRSVQVNESTVEGTLIEANSTGGLNLPMTSLQVKQREVTTTTSPSAPTSESNSLERWEIILIVSGILVVLLLLIICILTVKLAKSSGGFKRSQKYEVSRSIYTEYNDSITRSKSNLPVILSMEERRTYVKEDSYEDLSSYNIAECMSEESLAHNASETQLQASSFNSNSDQRNPTDESRQLCAKEDSRRALSTHKLIERKAGESLVHNADRAQLQASGFNRNPVYRNPSEGSTMSVSGATDESASTVQCLAHRNKGYDDVVIL